MPCKKEGEVYPLFSTVEIMVRNKMLSKARFPLQLYRRATKPNVLKLSSRTNDINTKPIRYDTVEVEDCLKVHSTGRTIQNQREETIVVSTL